MACAISGFFFLQASASPLLIGFHATAEVASRARTRRVKSLIGKRILRVSAAGKMDDNWERICKDWGTGRDQCFMMRIWLLLGSWLMVLVVELCHC